MTTHRSHRRPLGMLATVTAAAMLLMGCNPYSTGPMTVKDPAAFLEAAPCESTGTAAVPSALASNVGGPYLVESVVDGDTIRISCNGTSTRVRLVGVNTPETVKEDSPVECGGPEASDYLHFRLDGGQVFLSTDPARGERDQYDRLLAYVWNADGALVNQSIVELGHGDAPGYGKDYAYKDTFDVAADNAEAEGLGMWACP
ncbi:thermonuclease family protein [Arthrobacter sp. MP_2.3]|uniref:thermonuclease family protein n=1 Tax=Arthrobacter sp. MP_2.3 TaxID=3349633 RepID=UPI0038D4BF9A